MIDARGHFLLVAALAAALAVGGCGGSNSTSNSAAKVKQVRKGMTVQQVEQILGTPTSIWNVSPSTAQFREYSGYADRDGDHEITVRFRGGVVEHVTDMVPKKSHW